MHGHFLPLLQSRRKCSLDCPPSLSPLNPASSPTDLALIGQFHFLWQPAALLSIGWVVQMRCKSWALPVKAWLLTVMTTHLKGRETNSCGWRENTVASFKGLLAFTMKQDLKSTMHRLFFLLFLSFHFWCRPCVWVATKHEEFWRPSKIHHKFQSDFSFLHGEQHRHSFKCWKFVSPTHWFFYAHRLNPASEERIR